MTMAQINEVCRDIAGSICLLRGCYYVSECSGHVEIRIDKSWGVGFASWQLAKMMQFRQFDGIGFAPKGCNWGLVISLDCVSEDNGLTVVSWATWQGRTWAIVETVYSFGELRALLGY